MAEARPKNVHVARRLRRPGHMLHVVSSRGGLRHALCSPARQVHVLPGFGGADHVVDALDNEAIAAVFSLLEDR